MYYLLNESIVSDNEGDSRVKSEYVNCHSCAVMTINKNIKCSELSVILNAPSCKSIRIKCGVDKLEVIISRCSSLFVSSYFKKLNYYEKV